jgi:hypothetical protein
MQRDGHLGDPHSRKRCANDHLGSEFHASRLQGQPLVSILGECPQTAVEIMRRTFEKQSTNES